MRVFNKEKAFSILLKGTFIGDGVAARQSGINPATVTVWRKRLADDDKLRREYEKRLEDYRREWLKQAPSALTAGLAAYQSVAEHAAANPGSVTAEVFEAVISGIQTISKVTISQKYADVRLEHLKNQLENPQQPEQRYLPDVVPKQLNGAYPACCDPPIDLRTNGNGHVIDATILKEEE